MLPTQDGDKFWRMPEAFVRGNIIKYIRVPEEVRVGAGAGCAGQLRRAAQGTGVGGAQGMQGQGRRALRARRGHAGSREQAACGLCEFVPGLGRTTRSTCMCRHCGTTVRHASKSARAPRSHHARALLPACVPVIRVPDGRASR